MEINPIDPALGARIEVLRRDLDGMHLPACILDAKSRYRYVNPEHEKHFGWSGEALLGKTPAEAWPKFTPPDKRREALAKALSGETVVFDRETVLGPNNGRWVRAHYLPLREDDDVIGVLVVSVDIQHLKDTEQELAQRERQLALINENIGLPMSYVDAERRFRYTNQPGLDWNPGMTRETVIGRTLDEVFRPGSIDNVKHHLDRVFEGNKVVYERQGTAPDGTKRWIRVHLVPDIGSDGKVRGAYTIVIDVDDDHRLREALLEQEAQLRFFAENIPGPIAFVDSEFRYRFANKVFLALRGLDAADVVGRPVSEVFGAELSRLFFDPYVERLKRGITCEYERLVEAPGGQARWNLVRLVPIMGHGSRFDGYYIVGTDVHELKSAQDKLRSAQHSLEEKERQLRQVIDSIPTPMVYCDADACYRYVNRAFLDYIGLSADQVIGRTVRELLGEERWAVFQPSLERVRAGESMAVERMVKFADGRRRWLNVRLTPRLDADGKFLGHYATTSDIHEQKMVEDELRRASAILSAHFDNTPLGVVELDTEMRVVRWSGQAEAIFGWRASEVLGRGIATWRFVYEEDLDGASKAVRRLVDGPETSSTVLNRNYRKDGSVIWVEWHNSALRDESGRVVSLLALAQDVSSRIQAEERLQYMATHDGLTGLPNRVVLNERLASAIARSRRSGQRSAVMFLDLDRFKDVNDTLGHRIGDAVLRELAGRLRASLRQTDLLARISGDEFVMVLEELPGEDAPDRVAAKVLDEARRVFSIDGNEIHVSASVGVALYPEDGEDAETLLKHADAAMYSAKEMGRNTFRLYSSELASRRARRLEVEAALRKSLKAGELELHYQPVMDLQTGRVDRAEALLRWNDPVHGQSLPATFLPSNDETGLGHDLGKWVLEAACKQARAWRDAGLGDVAVCVNLAPYQLRDSALFPMLKRALAKTGCEPGWLHFEVTETSMVRDLESVAAAVAKLRALGIRMTIDDFGTGFSSLAHLRELPVDGLKMHRSLVADIDATAAGVARRGTRGTAIASAVIGLARGLGLEATAVGIEKKSQLAFLTRAGCAFGQGYLLCPPLPAPAFTKWLKGHKRKKK